MDGTRAGRLPQPTRVLRIGFAVLAVVFSLVAGVSGFVYPSSYSPLIVGGAIATTVAGIAWFRKPLMALYAALFVVLLPTGLIPSNIHSLLNRSMTMVALATWLFYALRHRSRVRWTPTAMLMLGFLAWSTVTLLWADNVSSGTTVLQAYALRLILYLFLIPNEIRTRENLDGLMDTLALNGWVLMVVSTGTVLLQGNPSGTRLEVLGMNRNEMGILALVMMIGVLWQALQPASRHNGLRKVLAFIFLLLTIGLVAASGSRGGAISLVITLLAFCFWRSTRLLGVLGLLALALGAILVPFLFSTTVERFGVMREDTLLGGREALWQATANLILNHPLGGVGIGNAPAAVMPYVRPLRGVLGRESAAVHNPLLGTWAETGMPGLTLYLALLGSTIWIGVRQYIAASKAQADYLTTFYAVVSSVFLGFILSWSKGGGMESHHTYFLMLALLLLPSHLLLKEIPNSMSNFGQGNSKQDSQTGILGTLPRT
jgi:O-antigen ligase